MTKKRWLAAASALSVLALTACEMSKSPDAGGNASAQGEATEASGLTKLARIEMTTDTSYLSAEEREVVNLLIQASSLMSEIYKRQATPDYDKRRAEVVAKNDPELLERFDAFFGPWDPINDGEAFFGGKPKPAGAGFYPADLTKEEFDKYLAANPGEAKALTDPYTVVKRQGGKLVAVPYSVEYKQWLEPAAKLLEQAAAKTTNPSLKKFLSLRAQAFRTDDYFQSELAWMDLTGTPIEIAIGPYEVYTDELYGRKTAFESFLTLKDPKESAALDVYKGHLRDMEANLPVEERYKNFQRGFESPIAVADQIKGGGDNVPGVQTIAFNLPNDERVREAKGAKKVILRNVLGAKYERILAPMATLTLVSDQAERRHQEVYVHGNAVPRAIAQPRAGLDRRQWPKDHRRQGVEGTGGRPGGSQGRRDGRLEHPLYDGQGHPARRREGPDSRHLSRRPVPRDAVRRWRGSWQGGGNAISLPPREGCDCLGCRGQALPHR